MEELRCFVFEGMADELEDPSREKESYGVGPEAVDEDAGGKQGDGKKNGGDSERVAGAVYRVLMAGGVLRDPLFVGASA